MRLVLRAAVAALAILAVAAPSATAQVGDVAIDPALGRRPVFGPGGLIGNGFGYNSAGPRGTGYYTGLYLPPNDYGNGPSPAYSPIFNSLDSLPPADTAPKGRAGWAFRPSLPFTGNVTFRPFRRR